MTGCVGKRMLQRLLSLLPVALLSLPFVLADRSGMTGVSPLNRVVLLISELFNIPILRNNELVQQVVLRFCLFILFLAVAHWVFKKLFDNKTSGVIATVFALISAFMMPANWVTANGGVITAVFSGLIPLGVIGLGLWVAVSKKALNKNFAGRLLGIVILLTLLAVIDVYKTAVGLPIILACSSDWLKRWFRR